MALPTITWQALNPVDDDLDGFADTLDNSRAVPLGRPLDAGRLPSGFRGQVAPLLRFLDARHLPYALTTDAALARGQKLEGAPGVALAGSERWLPAGVQRALRAYVDGGGTVASFGADSLRRTAELRGRSLVAEGRAQPRDVFGEQTELARGDAAPLTVAGDRLGIFGGDGLIGQFELFERSRALAPGARLLTSAGRAPDEPDFVAYRLGKGLVIRVGTPRWAAQLGANAAVADATVRMWKLLRRG